MAIAVFVVLVLFFGYLEKRTYGTIFTPAILLAVPYLMVIGVVYYAGESLGYYALYMPSIWVWTAGYFVFCSTGLLMSALAINDLNVVKGPFHGSESDVKEKLSGLLKFIACVCLVLMYVNLKKQLVAFNYDIRMNDDFNEALGRGPLAHAYVLIIIPIIYLITTTPLRLKNLFSFIIIALWVVYAFWYNSKIGFFFPFIAGIIGRFLFFKIKIRLIHIAIVIGVGLLVFFVSYTVSFGYNAPWWFIKKHFFFYTSSGVLGLSEYVKEQLDTGISFGYLFQPFVNIYNSITGNEIENVISDLGVQTSPDYLSSNVKTMFGTIYIYGGISGGIFTTIVWSFFVYLPLILSVRTKCFIFGVLYLYYATALMFAWFDTRFNSLSVYELLLFSILLVAVSKKRTL